MNQIVIKKVKKELLRLKMIKELSNLQAVQNLTKMYYKSYWNKDI